MKSIKLFLMCFLVLALASCNIPAPVVSTPTNSDPILVDPIPTAATPDGGGSLPAEPTATVPSEQPAAATDEAFVQKWIDAIQTRDLSSLRATMAPRFSVVTWNTSLIESTSEEVIARLQSGELADGAAPVVRFDADVSALLGGADPLAQWGPVAQPVRAVYITGLGADQSREAIAVFARDAASGTLYFHGLMVPETGTFATSGQPIDAMQQLSEHLALALEQRDFATLRALMRDRFAIATWNSSLEVIDADDALDRFKGAQLTQGSQPVVRWGTDIPAMLLGTDPLSLWGPVDQTVRAMHVMGLGGNATEEAVLVIGRDPATGDFYWHGILIPPDGYFHAEAP